MKALPAIVILAIFAVFAASIFAQSGRTDTKTDGKKNQRQEQPTPTPLKTPAPAAEKETVPASDDGEVIKVSTQLVSVPVRVMDKKGRFIAGLAKENFKVFENGTEQEIALFSNENEPFTVALVLDMSYSAKFKISEIQSAAIEFIDQLRPHDKVMVVSFDGEVHMLCEATSDRKEIYGAIRATKIGMGTSLYEAMDLVINNRLRQVEGRKAVILFSDGVDTTSRRASDLRNLHDATELDSLIYTIRYDTFADVQSMKNGTGAQKPTITFPPSREGVSFPFPLPKAGTSSSQGTTVAEYEKAAEYLEQLAMRTGGRTYDATTLGNLADAYSKIASELREFYSVGFYPDVELHDVRSSNVKIKVDKDGLVVRSRETFVRRRPSK